MHFDLSNYWDDFESRVDQTVDALQNNHVPKLKRLTVHITQACNFRCEYCNMHFAPKQMNVMMLHRIIDEFSNMGGSIIHFTGGEPTVYPNFESVCEHAKLSGLTVSCNTNAFRKINTDNIDKFKVSFDSADKQIFNSMMGLDAFDKVVANIKAYSEEMKDKMLSITAVLNKQTFRTMEQLIWFVVDNFTVYNLYFSNYKGNNTNFTFTDQEINEMFKDHFPMALRIFRQHGSEHSVKQLSLYRKDDFSSSPNRYPINKTLPCAISLSEMTIDVDGSCHNCSHLFRDGVRPPVEVDVINHPLPVAFGILKKNLQNNCTFMSEKCLSGCNPNLIGFNQAVNRRVK